MEFPFLKLSLSSPPQTAGTFITGSLTYNRLTQRKAAMPPSYQGVLMFAGWLLSKAACRVCLAACQPAWLSIQGVSLVLQNEWTADNWLPEPHVL